MAEVEIVSNQILKERNMTQLKLPNLTDIRYESISNLNKNKTERLSLIHLQKIMILLEITDVGMLLKFVDNTVVEPIFEPVVEIKHNPLDDEIELLNLPPVVFNKIRRHATYVGDLMKIDCSKIPLIDPKNLEILNVALKEHLVKHK